MLIGTAVLAFLAVSLVVGYHLRHHRQPPVVQERSVRATVGAVPWAVAGSPAAGSPTAGAQPPPVADAATPAVALAAGGVDLGNPSVVADGSGFSLFTTQATPFLHVPVVSATAGGSWGAESDALPTLPAWAGVGVVTAPVAHQYGDQWVLYFTAPVAAAPTRCIGDAVATAATGPYRPAPQPLVCQATLGGSSDPSVFSDGTTTVLVWLSADHQVWSQPLSADGQALAGQPTAIYRPQRTWQQGTLSSPSLLADGGRYWLLYSAGGGYTAASDAIGAASCASPSGPCVDRSGAPLLSSNSQGVGPGDPSLFTTAGQHWMVYNPSYSSGGTIPRAVDAVRLGLGPTGPYVATPGLPEAPAQPAPAVTAGAAAGRFTSTLATATLAPPSAGAAGPIGTGTGPIGTAAAGPIGTAAGALGTAVGAAGVTAVQAAVTQLGVPYVWGGQTPGAGFDCSGLVQWAWAQAGVHIPRTAAAQYAALPHVPLDALQPGDLLFYDNLDGDGAIDHVVMYLGHGPDGPNTVVQAPQTGQAVSYAPVSTSGLAGAARP
ncbi:MAG TPA: family 43 glycosylhydrolase [Acidimicrobiales bacterium]|nr:family 43 glycosylhydrolase [Acidimicrobiales bacterium]